MVNRIVQVVAIVIAAIAVVALVVGLATHSSRSAREPTLLKREGRTLVWPIHELPMMFIVDHTVDADVVARGMRRWLEWDPDLPLRMGTVSDQNDYLSHWADKPAGVVLVSSELLEQDECGGATKLHWDSEGNITFAEMVLNWRYTTDSRWAEWAVAHEIGHVLGLDDDPPPCFDSKSVMCKRLLVRSEPTRGDLQALRTEWRRRAEQQRPSGSF